MMYRVSVLGLARVIFGNELCTSGKAQDWITEMHRYFKKSKGLSLIEKSRQGVRVLGFDETLCINVPHHMIKTVMGSIYQIQYR